MRRNESYRIRHKTLKSARKRKRYVTRTSEPVDQKDRYNLKTRKRTANHEASSLLHTNHLKKDRT